MTPPTLIPSSRACVPLPRLRNSTRSGSVKRLSRRPPTRRVGRSPASAQRRMDASLTRRNVAASAVLSSLLNTTPVALYSKVQYRAHQRGSIASKRRHLGPCLQLLYTLL